MYMHTWNKNVHKNMTCCYWLTLHGSQNLLLIKLLHWSCVTILCLTNELFIKKIPVNKIFSILDSNSFCKVDVSDNQVSLSEAVHSKEFFSLEFTSIWIQSEIQSWCFSGPNFPCLGTSEGKISWVLIVKRW